MKNEFKLNTQACSIKDLNPKCRQLWSIGQQVAVRRLSVQTRAPYQQPPRYQLISDFSTRAARIAGNYARIYLELEPKGKPELKGRFYWTGLAAFASKQVMCALDYTTHTKMRKAPLMDLPLDSSKNFLGMGNFWLFQDIFVWHWFYINHPEQFFECIDSRSIGDCEDSFQASFRKLPWFSVAVPKINNLKVTPYLKHGFELIKKTESMTTVSDRRAFQYQSLIAIANHEQVKILQPLIYEDFIFRRLLDVQALIEGNWGVPRRLAALSTACETNTKALDTVMTKGELYDKVDRMVFITEIANKYHEKMYSAASHMNSAISTISTWSERT
ncbi:hypothetical protein CCL09_01435 [Pseudomonas congelans]|uniref:DUF2515 family protein n=1 Tax=Pseudomonas congelans TaxID=200452 RepID=UPI000BB5B37E|nr:hypothetical protein [Pseudomonas congelans]PBQ21033.1 hypothetical protein CCL09_01435 [Pseudomonas congelans]